MAFSNSNYYLLQINKRGTRPASLVTYMSIIIIIVGMTLIFIGCYNI